MRALLLVAAAAVAGCGDGPICQSEILLVIQTPDGTVSSDSNATLPGVQTDVKIRSTLPEGVDVTLNVLGAGGTVLSTTAAAVDADGNVSFTDITLPDGVSGLEATADAGECGSSEDRVPIALASEGVACELTIRQTPLANAYYAPVPVLNSTSDVNQVMPDFQGNVDIVGHGGDHVELLVTDASGVETSAGMQVAASDGSASFDVTLRQGLGAVRAICRGTDDMRTSSTVSVLVDTIAPTCAMTRPFPGTTLTPGLDRDGDIGDGLQLAIAGHADGGDVEGELATFGVTVDGATTLQIAGAIGADGNQAAVATIAPASVPASVVLSFRTHDHAGNNCADPESYDVVYDGCDIAMTAPTAPVTSDADGDPNNGAQVDVTLAIDPACAGQTVVSTCGLDDPSTTVAPDGSALLRVGWCSSDPCALAAACTFSVTSSSGVVTETAALIDFDDQPPP